MIAHVFRALLLALAALLAVLGPAAGAQAPWRDAEALRAESAQIQRRLFRAPDAALSLVGAPFFLHLLLKLRKGLA